MDARRAVKDAKRQRTEAELDAHKQVDEAKRSLGERGPVWWDDGAPDLNRHLVKNTPYAEWHSKAKLNKWVRRRLRRSFSAFSALWRKRVGSAAIRTTHHVCRLQRYGLSDPITPPAASSPPSLAAQSPPAEIALPRNSRPTP